MKNFTTKQLSLLPASIFLFAAFLSSTMAYSQSEKTTESTSKIMVKSSSDTKLRKTIEVKEINGDKVVTVTTVSDGNKNVEVYKGQEAEDFLENSAEIIIKEAEEHGLKFETDSDDDGEISIVMMKSGSGSGSDHKVIWVTDDDDEPFFKLNGAAQIEVDEENSVITISVNYTDEDGENTEKIIVFDETELVKSLEEMGQLLEDMDIDINMDISIDDSDGEKVRTVIVTKKIIIEEDENLEDEGSEMFKEFEVSPNPSKGQIKLNFEPTKTGKVKVSVLDIKGNVLYTDSYNGKSAYSKNISLENYSGVVILKIEQGNKVEIHKLIIE